VVRVDHQRPVHARADLGRPQAAEGRPLRGDHRQVGTIQRLQRPRRQLQHAAQLLRQRGHGRVVAAHSHALLVQPAAQFHRRRAPQRVRARLVRQAEHGDDRVGHALQHVGHALAHPALVQLVAGQHAREQRHADAHRRAAVHQEAHVARQRAARESGARRQVRPAADPALALQAALDLLGVGADRLAQPGQLVDERHRRGEEGVQRVLGHLARLDRHPLQPGAERREQLRQAGAVAARLDAEDDALGVAEDVDGLAQPQVLGGVGEVQALVGPVGAEPPREADRHLRGDQHQRAAAQGGRDLLQPGADEGHVGLVAVVDRRVVRHPQHVGAGQRLGRVGGEGQRLGGQPFGDQVVEARLVQRRLALAQLVDQLAVPVEADDAVARAGQAGGGDAAEVPQSVDGDSHPCLPRVRRWGPPTGRRPGAAAGG
jgi:hypothetical protein